MEAYQFTGVLVFAFIVSFFDAFSIGANDVANAFATSVASQSLTLKQACAIACFAEACGAIFLGKAVAETIRKGIADLDLFRDRPDLLMLGMLCANCASMTWTLLATKFGLPVSTTHSVVGGVIGMAVAAFGASAVKWGWDGVAKIVASWFISPVMAGTISASLFMTVKYTIMKSAHPYERAKKLVSVYLFVAVSVIVFFSAYKGVPQLKGVLTTSQLVGASFGVAAFCALISSFIVVPRLSSIIEKTPEITYKFDYAAQQKSRERAVENTKILHDHARPPTKDLKEGGYAAVSLDINDGGKDTPMMKLDSKPESGTSIQLEAPIAKNDTKNDEYEHTFDTEKNLKKPRDSSSSNVKESESRKSNNVFTRGMNKDVRTENDPKVNALMAAAEHYDPRAERTFSLLQVVTASCASFAHGANDLANALAPLATVYYIWVHGAVGGAKFQIPLWQTVYCAIALDVGLVMYGYHIMRSLGTHLTHQTPSRGFTMELGAMSCVLIASIVGIPVSTTHCITGATVGVGMTQGGANSVNWKHCFKIFGGWLITVPCTALISGSLFAALAYSPHM